MKNLHYFKNIIINILIGSLIIAALIAVVAVLVGDFNEIVGRSIGTIVSVFLHSLIIFVFIKKFETKNSNKYLKIFINTFFLFIIISFFTSIFGIWKILSITTVFNIYRYFSIIVFSIIHFYILSIALNKKKYIDNIIYSNYFFIIFVAILLFPILVPINSLELANIYYRILGAAGIINGTLSILTFIFYKLYVRQNPDLINNEKVEEKTKFKIGIFGWIVIIYLLFQLASYIFRSLFLYF